MLRFLKHYLTLNIISPSGLAIISYAFFLFAWLFPSGLYSEYLAEPNIVFLEPQSFLLVTLCILAFLIGSRLSGKTRESDYQEARSQLRASSPLFFLCLPLTVCIGLCLIYLKLLGGTVDVFGLLATQQGSAIKDINQVGGLTQGKWDVCANLLTGVLWWAGMRSPQFELKGIHRRSFNALYLFGMIVGIITCIARADRGLLIPLLVGTAMTSIFQKTWVRSVSAAKLLTIASLSAIGTLTLFVLLSFLRGAYSARLLIVGLMGYTIASYNRLAALVTGSMHYAYEGSGVYLIRYISEMHTNVFLAPIPEYLGIPDPKTVWQSEFFSVSGAGLTMGFNWSSAFGFVFSDIGWFSPLYFLTIGIVCGFVWRMFVRKRLLGLVIYPWFGYCILFWFGANFIFDYEVIALLELVIVLSIYEWLFRPYKTVRGEVPISNFNKQSAPGGPPA